MNYEFDFEDYFPEDDSEKSDLDQYEENALREDQRLDIISDFLKDRYDEIRESIATLKTLSKVPEYSVAKIYLEELKEFIDAE